MSLKEKDFKYYKKMVDKDKDQHGKMCNLNQPDLVIAAYNGLFEDSAGEHDVKEYMIEDFLFVAANTIVPSLFFQIPRITVKARRDDLAFSAMVINEYINVDFTDEDKKQNQLCILDAFLPYGYAIMKNGYNVQLGKARKKENRLKDIFTGSIGTESKNDMEHDNEFIRHEQSIGLRQDPSRTYLDATQPFGKGKRITFEYPRTVQDIIDSNIYKIPSEFVTHFKSRGDMREQEVTLIEHWEMIDGYAHKLVYIEEWKEEELIWTKTAYTTLPVSYLRFNQISPDNLVPYNISHGALAYRAQKELNYLNELYKKHLDNMRNQHLVYMDGLSASGKKTLRANEIGGIVDSDKPLTQGVAMPLQSATIDPRLFENISDVRSYLNLILSATGSKTGEEPSKLATTEKQKQLGDAMRASGMQDNIRDFIVHQVRQRIKNVMTLGSPEVTLKITGEGLTNPFTGQRIEPGSEIEIGGATGFQLQDLIDGDIDTEYIFEVDITTAQRPDFPVVRKQLAEGITLASQLEPKLQEQGKKVNFDKMLEDYFATFDAIPDAKKYISDLTEEEKQQLMQQMMAQQQMAMAEGEGVPTEEAISSGANLTPTETVGMGQQI